MILDGQIVGRPLISYKDTKTAIEALTGTVAGMTAYATDTNLTGYYTGSSWVWGVGSSGSVILALPQNHFFVGGSSGSAVDAGDGLTYTPATNQLNVDNIQWDLTPTPSSPVEGLMYWNTDDGTLNLGMPGGNVNLQLGQEMLLRAKNQTGSPITNGQLVYISSGTGSNAIVSLAKANAESTSSSTIGMATETITDGQFGYITLSGMVRNINTSGSAAGTVLYLSPSTAGAYTGNKPVAPNHLVSIGVIIRSHATDGVVFIRVDNGFEISELHDVFITSPVANQVLQYNSSGSYWQNSANTLSIAGNSTVNGSLVGNISGGGTLATGGFTLTVPKTGTSPVGTGTAGRIAEWVTDTNTLQASTLVKSGAGVLTLSSSGAFTLTVPATGTAALGTGANTRVTFWSGTNSLSSSANLIWDNTNNYLGIGGSPFANLTLIGSGGFFLASTVAGSVNKVAQITTARYTSGLVAMFSADIQAASHIINYGGGLGGNYAATLTRFYTAADVNTTTGTMAMSIDNNQNVGIGIDPAAYRLHALVNNATTNAADTVVCFGHNSTGTAAAGFGLTQLYTLESSTTADTSAAAWDVTWATATHASRKARIAGRVYDTAARTWLQVDTDGASSDVLINSLIYGSMYMDDGAQAVTATLANTYYEVGGGMTGSLTNGTTFQNSKELLITVAGTYEVDWSMSVSNSVSDNTVAGAVMVNSTEKHTTENATRAKENGVTYAIGGTGIIALAVNDVVKLCVENETAAGSTITVNHANLSIVRIGE